MKKIISFIAILVPSIVAAQPITDADTLVNKATNIGNTVIEILIAFAVIYIIYNVIRFIIKADSPEERKPIQGAILWGIVGLFVILSIWGLVRILTNTFRTDTRGPDAIPNIPTPRRIP